MAAYVRLLADAGYPVTVYSVLRGIDGESIRLDSRARHVEEPAPFWGSFRRSSALWRRVQASQIDLVHSYGLWTDVNRLAGDLARRRSLPHLLAPCGMLAPGALRRHWWKKLPARLWFQDRALREAQCLQAKSKQEYEHIRQFSLRNPVAVIPNPIAPPPVGGPVVRGWWSVAHNRRTILFLGRLHPVKGLPRLLRAWAEIQKSLVSGQWSPSPSSGSPSSHPWQLVLAGPDEGGHRSELESLVAELGCQTNVMFAGELNDNQKWGALAAADLFVMPSDFENFGNAIVEAMLSGLPVITTTGTPWQELPAAGAGWWIEPTVDALVATLREALELPEEKRREMGRQALKYSLRFRPEKAGTDLMQVYQWMLGRAPKPECVIR